MKNSTLLGIIILGTIGLGLAVTAVASFADLGGKSSENQISMSSSKSSIGSTNKNNQTKNELSKLDSEKISSNEEKDSSSSIANSSSVGELASEESSSNITGTLDGDTLKKESENTTVESSSYAENNPNGVTSEQNLHAQTEQKAAIETPAVTDTSKNENGMTDEVTYVTNVFPQTGEEKSQLPLIMGILLVVLVFLFLVLMRKKNKDEQNKKNKPK